MDQKVRESFRDVYLERKCIEEKPTLNPYFRIGRKAYPCWSSIIGWLLALIGNASTISVSFTPSRFGSRATSVIR